MRGAAKSKKRGGRIFCPEVQGENTGGTTISVRRGALSGTADVWMWPYMWVVHAQCCTQLHADPAG
jgi:hypothetical protein